MGLLKLDIENLRNLSPLSLAPGNRFNFFYGANGSGKTSLLEAIYLLNRGRSFRGRDLRKIVQHDRSFLRVVGELEIKGVKKVVGLGFEKGEVTLRASGRTLRSRGELARIWPLLLITPHCQQLLDDSPTYRRQFLDWGLFHVEQNFADCWQRYRRALSQRNSLLRTKAPKTQIAPWSEELVRHGDRLTGMRRDYVAALSEALKHTATGLDSDFGVKIELSQGWAQDLSLSEQMSRGLATDLSLGFTRSGPHRADLRLHVGSRSVKDVLSSGQKKKLVMSLFMAQARCLKSQNHIDTMILLDDITAELDQDSLVQVLNMFERLESQLFITSLANPCEQSWCPGEASMFHVEQGRVAKQI